MKRKLRPIAQAALGWLFSSLFISWVLLVSILTLGRFADSFGRWAIRTWGKTLLSIMDVKLELSGWEELSGRQMRVATFNHSSLLDIFIVCALLPEGGTPVAKRETLYVPFIGWGVYFLNFMAIDRTNRARARKALAKASSWMQRERRTVVISPEGTRCKDGELGPFRLGAFHLAMTTRAPIVPVVIEGARELMPYGSFACRPGRVRVRALPPIESHALHTSNLRQHADRLRELYLSELSQGCAAAASPAPSPQPIALAEFS